LPRVRAKKKTASGARARWVTRLTGECTALSTSDVLPIAICVSLPTLYQFHHWLYFNERRRAPRNPQTNRRSPQSGTCRSRSAVIEAVSCEERRGCACSGARRAAGELRRYALGVARATRGVCFCENKRLIKTLILRVCSASKPLQPLSPSQMIVRISSLRH